MQAAVLGQAGRDAGQRAAVGEAHAQPAAGIGVQCEPCVAQGIETVALERIEALHEAAADGLDDEISGRKRRDLFREAGQRALDLRPERPVGSVVDADADDGARCAAGLDQDAAELARAAQQVIRPFQLYRRAERAQCPGRRHAGDERERRELAHRTADGARQGERDRAARRAVPAAPAPAPAGGLRLRGEQERRARRIG
jgi:hypothetical protein